MRINQNSKNYKCRRQSRPIPRGARFPSSEMENFPGEVFNGPRDPGHDATGEHVAPTSFPRFPLFRFRKISVFSFHFSVFSFQISVFSFRVAPNLNIRAGGDRFRGKPTTGQPLSCASPRSYRWGFLEILSRWGGIWAPSLTIFQFSRKSEIWNLKTENWNLKTEKWKMKKIKTERLHCSALR